MATDLDDRMAAAETRLDALEAKPAGAVSADDDSSLDARIAALEKEVFPPKADQAAATDTTGTTDTTAAAAA